MPVTMGENPEEGFTVMNKVMNYFRRLFSLVLLGCFSIFSLWMLESCRDKGNNTTTIPSAPVSLVINLDLPAYFDLTVPGSFQYFQGGYRGVVVYHGYDDQYYAFDRTCAYQPLDDCSQLWVDSSTNQAMYCGTYDANGYTKCCDSRYELPTGFPLQGPATSPMRPFSVSRQGNTLYVNN